MKSLFTLLIAICAHSIMAQNVINAIEKCDLAKIQKYLDKGGDINTKFEMYDELSKEAYEMTLLDHAVDWECSEAIKLFISNKEKIEDYDLIITQSFIYSLSIGNDEISNLLYEQKPIPHGICDVCHGNNALMVAATYGRDDWYFKLKENSDLKYINSSGSNLIHCAASGPSHKILQDVLQIDGLDINRKDENGFTPLDDAASNPDNPDAFSLLIEKGADPKQAWNLLYWWCMYPTAPLTLDIIEERRGDVWMIDEEGDNCLMLLSYFYGDIEVESGVFSEHLSIILKIMIEDHTEGKSDLSFVTQFYQNGITINILDAMLFIEDFTADEPIYPLYLQFLGILCADAEFCPVYKKEYKTAVKIYGEELVTAWYEKYELPKE